MKNKVFLISLLLASSSVLAEQGVLENAGEQALKDAATSAAPKEAVQGVEAAGQAVEKAQDIKGAAETAPTAVKGQSEEAVKEAVKAKVDAATPEDIKKGKEVLNKGKKAAKKLKAKIPKSTGDASKAVEGKGKEKAAEKALELMH